MLKKTYAYLQNPQLSFFLFWVLVYLFSAGISNWYFSSTKEILITYAFRITLQFIVAYTILFVLVPKFLTKNHKKLFGFLIVLLLIIVFILCSLIQIYILEPNYPDTYVSYIKRLSNPSLFGRLTNIKEFISKSALLSYPALLLLAFQYYKTQKNLLELKEQKKTAELSALKNQLNPHFLFNTLNNLHALVLNKSDQSSDVIQKLSNILDYILYRCNDDYVSLKNEIDLLENYIALEQVRYGNRMEVTFEKESITDGKIAPLLLLTFLENAFKHGVSQELKKATIHIQIKQEQEQIVFNIKNSKPSTLHSSNNDQKAIGLQNIKKQLELLYPNSFTLNISNHTNYFSANLKLKTT